MLRTGPALARPGLARLKQCWATPSAISMTTTRYRPDVDGLRALAVVPVVLFHGHVTAFEGGFVGVDVFFVISGFLICSLIGSELEEGRFSIVRFYERRCRRILPALLVMFAVTSALAMAVLMPPDMASLGASMLASLAFASNMYFWKTSGYFDGAAELKPLLHTWSLSVEEQFYLVTPYVLMAIAVFFRKRYLAVLTPLALASFAVSIWAVPHAPSAAFYVLPTRFWEILLGGLCGLGFSAGPRARWVREGLAGLGLIGIVSAVVSYTEFTPFPGLAALLPCGGAALIIYAGSAGPSAVGRLLSLPQVVFIGKISYSLYLWHWPLLALYRYEVGRELAPLESVVIILISVGLAVVSYFYVEQPFRHPEAMPARVIFRASAWALCAAASFGAIVLLSGGLPSRFPGFAPVFVPGEAEYDTAKNGRCFLLDGKTADDWGGDECFVTRGRGPTVVLWGDSFAAHYVPGLSRHAARLRADVLQYNMSACPPVFGFESMSNPPCRAFNERVIDVVREYGARGVIVSGRWDYALRRHVTPEQIGASFARLQALGVEVIVIGQSPLFGNQVQTLFAQTDNAAQRSEAWGEVSFDADLNQRIASAVPDGVAFIDPLDRWCELPSCPYRRDGEFIHCDDGHLSVFGSSSAVASYFPFIDDKAVQ
jgi:peptidoglycan/LPS O-acetylase OafA/YrhL